MCRPTRNSGCGREDIRNLTVRNAQGDMIPLGTLVRIEPTVGAPLISLYNLYPSASIVGAAGAGLQFRPGDAADGGERGRTLPPGMGYRMDRNVVPGKDGRQSDVFVFAMALLLVYLVLAGQYESWYAPLSVILAVPLALIGPVRGARRAAASTTISIPRSA